MLADSGAQLVLAQKACLDVASCPNITRRCVLIDDEDEGDDAGPLARTRT